MMMIVGIDPGFHGGLAAIDIDARTIHLVGMPTLRVGKKREYDLAAIRAWLVEQTPSHVWIEAQGARPGQGVVSMFRLGWGAGLLVGLAAGLTLPYSLVWPARWRATMLAGLPPGKGSSILRVQQLFPRARWRATMRAGLPPGKGSSIPRVQQLSPHNHDAFSEFMHHGLAEALLIAEYGRRQQYLHQEETT